MKYLEYFVAAFVVAFAALAVGQEPGPKPPALPEISLPETLVAGQPVELLVANAVATEHEWYCYAAGTGLPSSTMIVTGKKDAVWATTTGSFRFVAVGDAAGKIEYVTLLVNFPKAGPTPVPPGPGPVPPGPIVPPEPPPSPTTGPKDIILIRETGNSNPNIANAVVALRSGAPSKYLKEKGHNLWILDQDTTDQFKKPSPLLDLWRPYFTGLKLPVLVITNKGKFEYRQEVPDSATADDIIAIVKGHGG